jgi:hypothetical protein
MDVACRAVRCSLDDDQASAGAQSALNRAPASVEAAVTLPLSRSMRWALAGSVHRTGRRAAGFVPAPIGVARGGRTVLAVRRRALRSQTQQRHVCSRVPPSARVRRERVPVASRLLLVVQGSGQRRVETSAADHRFRRGAAVSTCAPGRRPERTYLAGELRRAHLASKRWRGRVAGGSAPACADRWLRADRTGERDAS